MKMDRDRNPESRKVNCFARAIAPVTVVMMLTGCSSVPNWADPTKWFESNPAAQTSESVRTSAVKMPSVDKGFPNLASVPNRPKAPSKEDRKRFADSLRADRDNAEYSKDVIRRQSALKVPAAAKKMARSVPSSAVPLPLPPASRSPQIAPRPPLPGASAGGLNTVPPLAVRRNPNVRSIARVGNPSFGPPPADIAAALGAKSPQSVMPSRISAPSPRVPGTLSSRMVPGGTQPLAVVRFKAGSASLTRSARKQVRQIVGMYRQRGGAIRVEGHASSRTRDMDLVQHHLVNFNVSLNRANAVAREFVRQGVPSEAVFVAAMSDARPLFYEVMPAGDAGNQRVEIHFAK